MTASRLAFVWVLVAGCSSTTSGPGDTECNGNNDCESGQICTDNACETLCTNDGQCATGLVCTTSTCQPGTRSEPTILAVDGDGSVICPDAMGTHCIAAGMIIQGTNLEGVLVSLSPIGMGATVELTARGAQTPEQITVDLPDVMPGDYTLTVSNSAGTANQPLTLLQGPPGPDLTADEMITRINGGTGTIDAARLQLLAHSHVAAEITSGSIDLARLPTGTGATDLALGDHTHAYLPAAGGDVSALTIGGTNVCLADGTNCSNPPITQDVTATGLVNFSGLDGNAAEIYDFTLIGTHTSMNGSNDSILMRLNNATSGYVVNAHRHYGGAAVGHDTDGRSGIGMNVGFQDWSAGGTFFIEGTLYARTGTVRIMRAEHNFILNNNDRVMQVQHIAFWNNTTDNITTITFEFPNETFTGRISLRPRQL